MSKPVYGKINNTSRNKETLSSTAWVLIIGLIAFLTWAPFQAGLFNGLVLSFDKPILWAVLIGCILMLIGVAAFFKSFKLEDQRSSLAVLVLLLPLTYILSLISAASVYLAVNNVLIQCLYAFLFILSLYLLQNKRANRIMETALIAIAYIIVMFGLLNWLGQIKFTSALVGWFSNTVVNGRYTQAVWIDSNGPRLASIFQYPNTYAAFLMAFFFVALFGITRSKKGYIQAIHAFMLVPMAISVLLTLSRGGLVFLPVVFVILLLFLKPAKQLLWIIYSLIAGAATMLIAKPVTDLGQDFYNGVNKVQPSRGWFYVLGASLAVTLLIWLLQRFAAPKLENGLQGWAKRKTASLWLPIVSVVGVAVIAVLLIGTSARNILPGNIGERLETINFQQHSVLERLTFYKDAVKVVKDYPVVGAGGGAWASLYQEYQNNPYTSRQAHSFFMQYLVEVGLLGFVVFMAFIIYIFYKYIRGFMAGDEEHRNSYFVYFILVLSILLHSAMDFNISYVFIGMLVFVGLGGMAAAMHNKPLGRLQVKPEVIRPIYSVALGVVSLVLVFITIRYISAADNVTEGQALMKTSQNYQEIKAPLAKAMDLRADLPDAVLYTASLDQAVFKQTSQQEFYDESYVLLTKALKKEPYNQDLLNQLMAGYQLNNQADEAYKVLADNAYKFAWDINWYEKLIAQSFELGYQALGQGETDKEKSYFNTGIEAYQHVVKGVAHLATLPSEQLQGRPFSITATIALNAGKMQLLSGKAADAAATLKQSLTDDYSDATNVETATWYLAALQKSGGSDQTVHDKLLAAQPSQEAQIDSLVQIAP
ncbi:O-antigen ligase family protein [Paenibacillus pinistramenti]|uniref:O-antigen ligase family protein n=1 Tax=Paenibacillus pinistramenti TaxID=1768003 RepID=UPI0011096D65|nr:O-antigen ligase family protein [Paenibacillus pinistramenti]